MSPEDAARWLSARTLADLGELTAGWLEGAIASQPDYAAGCGPDEETAELIPVLAACNRAGYLTISSQPGEGPETGYNGNTWVQRAAVDGYASAGTLKALRTSAAATPLIVVAAPVTGPWDGPEPRICVTMDGSRQNTWFGGADPSAFSMCHPDAIAAIHAAWQVAIIDPQWGRNTILWPVLSDFATQRGQLP